MALIKCPECSNLVSDTCDVCIHCGFKLTKKTIEKVDLEDFEIVSGNILKKYKRKRHYSGLRRNYWLWCF